MNELFKAKQGFIRDKMNNKYSDIRLNSSVILLYDSGIRILLQRRTIDARRLPGYWAFFGGQIENGETPWQTVYREAHEELNYELKAPQLIYERDFILPTGEKGHLYVFIEKFCGARYSLSLQEGQDWGWYRKSEINDLKMIEHDREIFGLAINIIEGNEM